MERRHALKIVAATPFLLTGCNDSSHDHDHDHDDDHDAGHDGNGNDASKTADTDVHAPRVDLGSVEVGGYTVTAAHHGYEAGSEGHITLDITGGDVPPGIVRVWIGVESGEGSVKRKFDVVKEGDAYRKHDHVEVPAPLPDDAALWIEIEGAKGSATGSLPLKK